MNYNDGERVMVGDRVKLWEGCFGIVVCSIDDDEYTADYRREDWSYLRSGVLVNSEQGGLIHYLEPESTFELVERARVSR